MDKTKIIIALVLLAGAYATGRYMSPEKIKVEKEVVTQVVEKIKTKTVSDLEKTITETINVDGSRSIITVLRRKTSKENEKDTESKTEVKEITDIQNRTNSVTINALGGLNVLDPKAGLIVGGQISKPLLGPVVLGIWGMSNKTAGVSLGLQL